MAKGKLIGVGVGPGDPEMMTLKAVRVIRENPVIAFPGKSAGESTAYGIAVRAVPEMAEKELVPLDFPMVTDEEKLEKVRKKNAAVLESIMDEGKNVVFLTLGDPSVYSTFSGLNRIAAADGYLTEMISGVPSFCAAAAALGISLADGKDTIRVIPASSEVSWDPGEGGTTVLMKSGRRFAAVREKLQTSGQDVRMVENCGMPDERKYAGAENLPEKAGYFSLIIVRSRTDE
ncbi:MAG: precorrin-2 C(20)-methyltransferase [Eubacteriales bacterium]|jgi:precorrin-2/cobalt-factor-2 C20-methyltransferase